MPQRLRAWFSVPVRHVGRPRSRDHHWINLEQMAELAASRVIIEQSTGTVMLIYAIDAQWACEFLDCRSRPTKVKAVLERYWTRVLPTLSPGDSAPTQAGSRATYCSRRIPECRQNMVSSEVRSIEDIEANCACSPRSAGRPVNTTVLRPPVRRSTSSSSNYAASGSGSPAGSTMAALLANRAARHPPHHVTAISFLPEEK
jgi:hypothetical protein